MSTASSLLLKWRISLRYSSAFSKTRFHFSVTGWIPATSLPDYFSVPVFLHSRSHVRSITSDAHNKEHERQSSESEYHTAWKKLNDMQKQLQRKTPESENNITRISRPHRRRKPKLPCPPDERQTDPLRKHTRPTDDPFRVTQGPTRRPTHSEKEKIRKRRLEMILNGTLEFRKMELGRIAKLDSNEPDYFPEVEDGGERIKAESNGSSNEISTAAESEFLIWNHADVYNASWMKTKRKEAPKMSNEQWDNIKRLLREMLDEQLPIISKETLDAAKRKLRYKKQGQTYDDTSQRDGNDETWESTDAGTTWGKLKKLIIESKTSCRQFPDLTYLCKLIGEQQNRILNKYMSHDYDRQDFDLYFPDIRETELWSAILDSNYMLMMNGLRHPYNLTGFLNIVSEMQRNAVHPVTHITAVCHLSTEGNVLLAASARPKFIHCLIRAGVFEKRVGRLILARHLTGDFRFGHHKSWLLHLEYLDQCFNLSQDQMLILTRPLHRALALGQLTADEKTRIAQIYVRQHYKHLTFFNTIGKELQQQLEVELLLYEQLLDPEVYSRLPGETTLQMKKRFAIPVLIRKMKGKNRSNLTSVFLNREEMETASQSHHEFGKLLMQIESAVKKYGKEASTKLRTSTFATDEWFQYDPDNYVESDAQWFGDSIDDDTIEAEEATLVYRNQGSNIDEDFHGEDGVISTRNESQDHDSIHHKQKPNEDQQPQELNGALKALVAWRASGYLLSQIATLMYSARTLGLPLDHLTVRLPKQYKSKRPPKVSGVSDCSTSITLRDAWLFLAAQHADFLKPGAAVKTTEILSMASCFPALATVAPVVKLENDGQTIDRSKYQVKQENLEALMMLITHKFVRQGHLRTLGKFEADMLEEFCRWFCIKTKHRVLDRNSLPTDNETVVSTYRVPSWMTHNPSGEPSTLDLIATQLAGRVYRADPGPLCSAVRSFSRLGNSAQIWEKRAMGAIEAIKKIKASDYFVKSLSIQYQRTRISTVDQKWNNIVVHLGKVERNPKKLYKRLG